MLRRLGRILHRPARDATSAPGSPVLSPREQRRSSRRWGVRPLFGNDECEPIAFHMSTPFSWFGRKVSNPHLKDQNLASCRWTTPERTDGGVNGYRPHYSWVETTRVSVITLTPKSSRRGLTPRPPRWQRGALPLSYYCDGGTGWSFTSVSRVAIGYLNPRPRCQGCGGGHRTPDAVVNGHPLYR